MLSFLEFIKLQEGLSIKDGVASISYNKSEDDIHSLIMGKDKKKTPYITSSKSTNNHPVYSSYSFVKNNINTDILKALKKKSNSSGFTFSDDELNNFIIRSAYHLWVSIIRKLNIDVVATIQSQSELGKKFSNEFQKRIPNVVYLPDSIIKSHISNLKIASNTSPAQQKMIQGIVDRHKRDNSNFNMKEVPGRERQFVKNFLEWKDIYNKIQGKKVLIVDDYLTTGSTMAEAFRVMDEMNPSNVYGVTLIK